MAQSWKYAFALGLVGSALAVGCVVKEGDGDAAGGASGEAGAGGSTGGKGGSGGSGGKATGGSAGKATGGGAGTGTTGGSSGSGGTTGGSGGDAGMSGSDTGGTGGTAAGTGGTGGTDIVAVCEGVEDSTPYPTCEAEGGADDDCGTCIEMNCCAESKACYATEPYDACGWGGPSEDMFDGLYSGAGEIGCYLTCMAEYVAANDGICDDAGIDECNGMCASDCGGIPSDSMNALLTCVNTSCSQDCFASDAETCGD